MNVIEAERKKTETKMPEKRRICFVCTGNTCRSPMAAAVANALAAKETGGVRTEAYSAGISACEGEPIAENAAAALESAGIPAVPGHDYHVHAAHTLCAEEAERYDMLIGMTGSHAMALILRFPHLATRISVLPQEISDPYGGDAQTYRQCLAQIADAVKSMLFAGTEL